MSSVSTSCAKCGAQAVSTFPVLHHFLCAYVGPSYDFAVTDSGYLCPKCGRTLKESERDWEILGDSSLCESCKAERML